MTRTILTLIVFVTFLLSCEEPEEVVTYQPTGLYGQNILYTGQTEYFQRENSLQARVPVGFSVYIRITGKTVTGGNGSPLDGIWHHDPGTVANWVIGSFNMSEYSQVFTLFDGGQTCDVRMIFDEGSFLIEYYEHGLSAPSFTKTITVAL